MATNREIRTALAGTLASALGGEVHLYPKPPDKITAPAVIFGGVNWEDQSFDGRTATVPLYVAVSRRNTDFLDDLDDLCDPDGKIVAAVRADPTLGDVVDSARFTSAGNYRDLTIADTDYYAATLTLEVYC